MHLSRNITKLTKRGSWSSIYLHMYISRMILESTKCRVFHKFHSSISSVVPLGYHYSIKALCKYNSFINLSSYPIEQSIITQWNIRHCKYNVGWETIPSFNYVLNPQTPDVLLRTQEQLDDSNSLAHITEYSFIFLIVKRALRCNAVSLVENLHVWQMCYCLPSPVTSECVAS